MTEALQELMRHVAKSRFPDEEMIVEAHGEAMIADAFAGRSLTAKQEALEHEFGEAVEATLEIVKVILATVNTMIALRDLSKETDPIETAALETQWIRRLEDAGLQSARARGVVQEFLSDFCALLSKPNLEGESA